MKSIQHDQLEGFYFIVDWPTSTKPFYIKPSTLDGRVCESFDLMYGALEISSGDHQNKSEEDQLVERIAKQGLKPEAFDYHLRVFDYGVPPHAGFGLGLERTYDGINKSRKYPRHNTLPKRHR